MPDFEITAPNGKRFIVTAPAGASHDEVLAYAREQWQPEPVATDVAKSYAASAIGGALDPIDGLAQLLPRAGQFVTSGGGAFPNAVSDWFGDESKRVDRIASERDSAVESYRQQSGRSGFDVARLLGNIANPVNWLPATNAASKITNAGGRALGAAVAGARAGAVTAAAQPIQNAQDDFLQKKLSQILFGGATGAVAAPLTSKAGEAIVRQVDRVRTRVSPPDAGKLIDDALREVGLSADEIGARQIASLRGQVGDALRSGKVLDPAALLRKADFDSLGIKGTAGQVLRHPNQFAREKNLRGLEGVGERLQARFVEQDRAIQSRLGSYAEGAADDIDAGRAIVERLANVDRGMADDVRSLYKTARAAQSHPVPTTGLAQDAARIIGDYREKLPGGIVNRLRGYGFLDGKQTKLFDIDEAESLIKLINSHGNRADRAELSALSELREAVKRAITEGADGGGPYAPARRAAAERFALHDALPALRKVAQGEAEPDAFVSKHIMRAPVSEVNKLAGVLDDQTKAEAKRQIGEHLRRAAYGDDFIGDKGFQVNRYNAELRKLGERLQAFFSDDEIRELRRIGRVSSYINQAPKNAAVNNSNTAGALFNLTRAAGGGLSDAPLLSVLGTAGKRYAAARDVDYALTGGLQKLARDLSTRDLSRIGLIGGESSAVGSLLLEDALAK